MMRKSRSKKRVKETRDFREGKVRVTLRLHTDKHMRSDNKNDWYSVPNCLAVHLATDSCIL
jgi:hypothetical protein